MEYSSNHCGPALRVLVVEDHEDTATSLGASAWVRSGNRRRRADRFACRPGQITHVVLLDIGLPKMNGWQVAEQIHKLSAPKRPLLIAITGYGTQEDHIRSAEAGIDFHWVKPADMVALDKLLRRFQEVILPAAGEAPSPVGGM